MKKICLINQPAGIGDVFFLQKMVKMYIAKGYNVIFPLLPEIMFIKDYIKIEGLQFVSIHENFPFKNYLSHNNVFENEHLIYIPARYADNIYPNMSCMEAKYKLIDLDFSDWSNYFVFERNMDKENELFYDVLKLRDGEKYSFVSNIWGTPPNTASKKIIYDKTFKTVYLELIPEFTLFDWCKVIENANHISIVDTSLNYIIEKLNLNSETNFLTSRFTPPNFYHIINLFNKNWKYIQ